MMDLVGRLVMVIAIAGVALIARRQLATLAAAALVVTLLEESFVSGLSVEDGAALVPGWMRIGHWLWERPAGAPSIVAAFCIAVIVVDRLPKRTTRTPAGRRTEFLLLGLAATSLSVDWLVHAGGLGAGLRQATPWVIGLGGLLIVRQLRTLPDDRRVLQVLLAGLVLKSLYGLVASRTTEFVPFYDGATPMVAGLVLAVLVLRPPAGLRTGTVIATIAASSSILLISSRRTPLLASVLVLLLVAARSRPTVAIRAVLAVACVGGALIVLAPGQASHVVAGARTVFGDSSDESAQGHVDDFGVALSAASANAVFGVGSSAPQLAGAANTSTDTAYVHNEYLQVWLRFGISALALLLALIGSLALRAWRILSRPQSLVVNLAAFFLLALPIVMVFFPAVTGSQRWALALGLAAGVITRSPAVVTRKVTVMSR